MKYNISKELFEEVMKVELAGFSINQQNIIEYIVNKVGYFEVQIDTFFFKCKEWAFENFNCEIYTSTIYGYILDKDNNLAHESIYLKSEQQYCFDACEWIIENKK